MGDVSRFLHKCSLEVVKEGGGLIPGQNQVRATVDVAEIITAQALVISCKN